MFTAGAIILANIFVTFPLAFGVIKPVFDTMNRSLEEASATIGATRWQTFWHVTMPSLRGAIVSGALLTFARAVGGRFDDLVSGNLASRTQTAPSTFLRSSTKDRSNRQRDCDCAGLVIVHDFSVLFFARDWLDVD
jgi:ABC-type sulfate transport system permease component